ncbi:MAG: sialidase family protein [Bacteroidota bacterium]
MKGFMIVPSFFRLLLSLILLVWLAKASLSQPIQNLGFDPVHLSTEYHSLPFLDWSDDTARQVVVDRKPGEYLGHPTTVLLKDGKTILAVYPKGHGRGAIIMKRSRDGGKTWSERLPTPASWETSLEVPTIHPVVDAAGKERLIMFSGLYPARMAVSEDQGDTWSELEPLGDWGGIVVMGDLIPLQSGKGHYMALFHDDGRFFTARGRDLVEDRKARARQPLFTLYQTFSFDGGLTWSQPHEVFASRMIHLCEPGLIRSPDGNQIAMLLRENSRRMNSFIMFSNDEGKTWSHPRELPNSLTGDRHQAVYLPDDRLLISFRDNSPAPGRWRELAEACSDCDPVHLALRAGTASPTHGDWVAWLGTYKDLATYQEGQARIRFKDNTRHADCAYPALEILPDGTVVATTYGHWDPESVFPYILSVRFKMEEIDAWLKK